MKSVLFITNVSRRHAMMAKAIKQLSCEQQLALACESILLTNEAGWSKAWEQRCQNAAVVISKWKRRTGRAAR